MEQKFEFDAPVYFNFDDVLSGVEVVGDDTDQWFMSERPHIQPKNDS